MQKTCRVSRFYISKPRFGYKNSKKLSRGGRNLITETGPMIGHLNSFLDQRWGEFEH